MLMKGLGVAAAAVVAAGVAAGHAEPHPKSPAQPEASAQAAKPAGMGALVTRLESEAKAHAIGADMVLLADPTAADALAAEGILSSQPPSAASHLPSADQGADWVGAYVFHDVIVYHKGMSLPVPRSWRDLTSAAFTLVKQGSPIGVVWPQDGAIVVPGPLAFAKGHETPVAKAFANWLLSPAGQKVVASVGLSPVLGASPTVPKGAALTQVPWTELERDRANILREFAQIFR